MTPPQTGSSTACQALQAQPLLRPKATPVIALLLDLVTDAGGVIALLKIGRTKEHVPPRQQDAKIAPAQRVARFMADANAVVHAVKTRADPAFSPRAPQHWHRP